MSLFEWMAWMDAKERQERGEEVKGEKEKFQKAEKIVLPENELAILNEILSDNSL